MGTKRPNNPFEGWPDLVSSDRACSWLVTYGEGMLATTGPVVRYYVVAILLAVVDEVLDVVIASVAGDARNDASAVNNDVSTPSRSRDHRLGDTTHSGTQVRTYQMKPLEAEFDSSQSMAK